MDFQHSAADGRRILVLANCQTGGLKACLDLLLPNNVVSGEYWSDSDNGCTQAAAAAALADVVVTSAPAALRTRLVQDHGLDEAKCLTLPSIHFAGFHPDLTIAYSAGRAVDGIFGTPYQSAIGVWCWKQQIEVSEACRLFTPETMTKLGFDRSWTNEVARAREEFDASPISFTDFFLPLQASGKLFMHSFNHPHISAIAQLARGVARYLGASEADLRQPVETMVPDALCHGAIWPVYPGVAEALALPASSFWKFDNGFYDLETYLDAQFRALDAVDGPVVCYPSDDPSFDAAMRSVAAR